MGAVAAKRMALDSKPRPARVKVWREPMAEG